MLRLSLRNLIASRNPKEGDYLDGSESEICIQEKQIIWPEGKCGGLRLKGEKQLFPNIQSIVLIKEESICSALH